MKGFKTYIFTFLLFFLVTEPLLIYSKSSTGDPLFLYLARKKQPWIVGVGWNAVDDNGNPFKRFLSFKSSWNIRPYPTQISVEHFIDKNWSYGGILNYTLYKPGKLINNTVNGGRSHFFSVDAFAKYYLNDALKLPDDYDLYIPGGFGYTLRTVPPYFSTFTFNLGAGFNYWINGSTGINFQSVAKFGLRSPIIRTGSNYLQHSFTIIVFIDNSKNKNFSFHKPKYKWVHNKSSNQEKRRRSRY